MSDNIIIGVHGQAQTLEGINGINAKEPNGGSTNYLPEDTLKVGGKTVTQNGTYNAADDNMLGYKRVVVMDLVSEGPSKTFQDTRKHNAMITCGGRQRIFANVKKLRAKNTNDEDYTVAPSPNMRTKSLSVLHPGVYDVSSETDVDVYTPVYVSVSDSERDAAGFNPSNPTWQDNLPDEIRVTTPPTKTEYVYGEEIDYTGMVVQAYKNGSVWSNANYPNGVIPLEELETIKYVKDKNVILPREITGTEYQHNPAYNYWQYNLYAHDFLDEKGIDGDIAYLRLKEASGYYYYIVHNKNLYYEGYDEETYYYGLNGNDTIYEITSFMSTMGSPFNIDIMLISKSEFTITKEEYFRYHDGAPGTIYKDTKNAYKITRNNLDAYMIEFKFVTPSHYDIFKTDPNINNVDYIGYTTIDWEIAVAILYGEKTYVVKWKRPGDKKILQAELNLDIA